MVTYIGNYFHVCWILGNFIGIYFFNAKKYNGMKLRTYFCSWRRNRNTWSSHKNWVETVVSSYPKSPRQTLPQASDLLRPAEKLPPIKTRPKYIFFQSCPVKTLLRWTRCNPDETSDKTFFFFLKKIRSSRVFVTLKTIWSYSTLINIKLRLAHVHYHPIEPL